MDLSFISILTIPIVFYFYFENQKLQNYNKQLIEKNKSNSENLKKNENNNNNNNNNVNNNVNNEKIKKEIEEKEKSKRKILEEKFRNEIIELENGYFKNIILLFCCISFVVTKHILFTI